MVDLQKGAALSAAVYDFVQGVFLAAAGDTPEYCFIAVAHLFPLFYSLRNDLNFVIPAVAIAEGRNLMQKVIYYPIISPCDSCLRRNDKKFAPNDRSSANFFINSCEYSYVSPLLGL
jgi:hypothetical protein